MTDRASRRDPTKADVAPGIYALLFLMIIGLPAVAQNDDPVAVKDLRGLHVPGKVEAAIWTVRHDVCTLQVVFPNRSGITRSQEPGSHFKFVRPVIQVWLLRADGTVIAPTKRVDPSATSGEVNPRTPYGVEVLFAFPLTAAEQAIAVAIKADDEFYVTPISGNDGARAGRIKEDDRGEVHQDIAT